MVEQSKNSAGNTVSAKPLFTTCLPTGRLEEQVWRDGGLGLKWLKDLEEENAKLKKVYAELSLDHSILKDVILKKAGALLQEAVDRRDCQ